MAGTASVHPSSGLRDGRGATTNSPRRAAFAPGGCRTSSSTSSISAGSCCSRSSVTLRGWTGVSAHALAAAAVKSAVAIVFR
jgi:hypothetical protein